MANGGVVVVAGATGVISPPGNLTAVAGYGLVTLQWAQSGAVSYNVYRAPGQLTSIPSPSTFIQLKTGILSTTWTDLADLQNDGQGYTYYVTSVDSQFNESQPSNLASAIPSAKATGDPTSVALTTVNQYSAAASVVGLLPGGPLNFVGLFAVLVLMVNKIAADFKLQSMSGNFIKVAVAGLLGASVDVGVGGPLQLLAWNWLPFRTFSSIVGYLVSPGLAYTITQAVGRAFILHFQSGGTLLSFDPLEYQRYMAKTVNAAVATKAAAA